MEKVLKDLKALENQGNTADFINNDKDGKKLTSLAQNIRDAMMEYQVRTRVAAA